METFLQYVCDLLAGLVIMIVVAGAGLWFFQLMGIT